MTDAAHSFRPSNFSGVRNKRRGQAERRFRLYGLSAVILAVSFLLLLVSSIVYLGIGGFWTTEIRLPVTFTAELVDPEGTGSTASLADGNYRTVLRQSLAERFPEVEGRRAERQLNSLVSRGASLELREMALDNPSLVGTTQKIWLLADDRVDMLRKGQIDRNSPEDERPISDKEISWLDQLSEDGDLRGTFNSRFFSAGDSREPEMAGIWGAIAGSALTLVVTLLLSAPIGVMAAIYLEEFATKNRWSNFIEVNINNLAAVPSIVFGLLGLAVFLNFANFPRSAPLVGGMTLALMTLPTIIIASRAALKAVPPSIREAAQGLGASPVQVVSHHVLPLAMPGILTGTIIGMAQALGETAPLLMIGMVAFIVDIPNGFTDAATVLPVQIYLWADSPERAFAEKTAAATMVLLLFLIIMNAVAVFLRRRFERRW